jgi:hypothetical protein
MPRKWAWIGTRQKELIMNFEEWKSWRGIRDGSSDDILVTEAANVAVAHERELLPCSHPKACLILKEPNGPIGSIHVFAEDDEYICAWCESLAHERQRVVELAKELKSKWDGYGLTEEDFAAFIKRLEDGK